MIEALSARDKLLANRQRLKDLLSDQSDTGVQVVHVEPIESGLEAGEAVSPVEAVVEVVNDPAVGDEGSAVEGDTATTWDATAQPGVQDTAQKEQLLEGPAPVEDVVADAIPSETETVEAPPTQVELAQAISQVTKAVGGEARFVAENKLQDILLRWDASKQIPNFLQTKIDALNLDASKPTEPVAVEVEYPVKDQKDKVGVLTCVREAIAATINYPESMIDESNSISGDLMIDEAKFKELLSKLGVQMLQFNLTNEATVADLVMALSTQYGIGEGNREEESLVKQDEEDVAGNPNDTTTTEPSTGSQTSGGRFPTLQGLRNQLDQLVGRVAGARIKDDTKIPEGKRAQEPVNVSPPSSAADVLNALRQQVGPTHEVQAPVQPATATELKPGLSALPEELPVANVSMQEILTKVGTFFTTEIAEAIKAGNEDPAKIQLELAKLGEAILLNIAEVRNAMGSLEKPEQVKPAVVLVKNLLRLAVSAKIVSPEAQKLRNIGSVADLAQTTEDFLNHYSDAEELEQFSNTDRTSLEVLINHWWRVLVDVVEPDQQKDLIDKELVPLLLLEAKVRLLKKW